MMPLSTFNVLLVVVVLLVVFALVDYRNKLYGNIASAIIASIVSSLLAILIYIGAVETESGARINDFPTAGVLLLIAVGTAIYAFFMIMEVREELESAQELA